MSQPEIIAHISPYVAAAIIEHGKRRSIAAGFILGERSTDEVRILDYFPFTHVEAFADVSARSYREEVDQCKRTKNLFTTASVLGWYSAGNCPADVTEDHFSIWCESPAMRFVNSIAIHVHCALPEQDKLSVSWTVTRMRTYREANDKVKMDFRTVKEATLPVVISAMGHVPSNVFLDHVASMALYGGKKPYPTSDLLNLDLLVYQAAKLPQPLPPPQQLGKEDQLPPRPLEEVLLRVHNNMNTAIQNASAACNGAGNVSAEDKKVYEDILASLAAIRATKETERENQNSPTARDDVSSQRFKDALMIKCMSLMLRRDVRQIEYLAQDNKPNKGGHDTQNTRGGGGMSNNN